MHQRPMIDHYCHENLDDIGPRSVRCRICGSEVEYDACYRCGECCRSVPCGYGEWNADETACRFLIEHEDSTTSCGRYEHILIQPGSHIMPAFGAGCCRTLFNEKRKDLIRAAGGSLAET